MKRLHEFDNLMFVTFLALRGHKVTPLRHSDGRITFEVEGDIAKAAEAFYADEKKQIMRFVRILKALQSLNVTKKAKV